MKGILVVIFLGEGIEIKKWKKNCHLEVAGSGTAVSFCGTHR